MSRDLDWDVARRHWQQDAFGELRTAPVLHRARRAQAVLIGEALFNLLAVGALTTLALLSTGSARSLLLAAAAVGAILAIVTARARLRLLRARVDSPHAFVRFQLRQSQLRHQLAWLTVLGTPAGLFIGLSAAGSGGLASAFAPLAALNGPVRIALILGLLLVIGWGGWQVVRQRQAMSRHVGLLAELED